MYFRQSLTSKTLTCWTKHIHILLAKCLSQRCTQVLEGPSCLKPKALSLGKLHPLSIKGSKRTHKRILFRNLFQCYFQVNTQNRRLEVLVGISGHQKSNATLPGHKKLSRSNASRKLSTTILGQIQQWCTHIIVINAFGYHWLEILDSLSWLEVEGGWDGSGEGKASSTYPKSQLSILCQLHSKPWLEEGIRGWEERWEKGW